jgi:rare lipoprotein A
MRRRMAQWLTLGLVVGLGAAQEPPSSGSIHKATGTAKVLRLDHTLRPWLHVRPSTHAYQIGNASWYGQDFVGKPTASGEPYDMYDLTAAHPKLALGTLVRVTNLQNHRSVVVRINDRGPVVPDRIIDVSYSAAKILKFQVQGVQRVRLDLVSTPGPVTEMAMLQEPALRR